MSTPGKFSDADLNRWKREINPAVSIGKRLRAWMAKKAGCPVQDAVGTNRRGLTAARAWKIGQIEEVTYESNP
jgi:hypothetical protein